MDAEKKRIALQVVLFVLTFLTATIAGAEWRYGYSLYAPGDYTWEQLKTGLPYSISFLFILSVHEFGHYFTARYHQIKTSLPYYIPLPPFPGLIGTMGALIRIRQRIPTTTINFDVGIAGPLAGFMASIGVLIFGMLTLPPPEYMFAIHPEYKQFGLDYSNHVYAAEYLQANKIVDIQVGRNLMMDILALLFADPARMPNRHELMHYPILFAGYLSLFFTALNLIPLGQLDGGHVAYGLFGAKRHYWIARVTFVGLIFISGIGFVRPGMTDSDLLLQMPLYAVFLYFIFKILKMDTQNTIIISLGVLLTQYLVSMFFPDLSFSRLFLLYAFLIGRFVGIDHPGAEVEEPLTQGRKVLGWIAFAILVLCFTPSPLSGS